MKYHIILLIFPVVFTSIPTYTLSQTLTYFRELNTKDWITELPNYFPKTHISLASNNSDCLKCLKDFWQLFNDTKENNKDRDNFHKYSGRSINELGDFYACKENNGRHIVISMFILKIGLCLPDSCTGEVINELIEKLRPKERNRKESNGGRMDSMQFVKDPEAFNNKELTRGTYILSGILIFITVGSILAALVDECIGEDSWKSRSRKILQSFNVYKNAKSMFCSENRVDKNLDILNGVKVLFMSWIVFGHLMMMTVNSTAIQNVLGGMEVFLTQRRFAFYISGNLAVDVFFWLTGFLAILVCTEQLRVRKHNTVLTVLLIYLHRYIRMLPIYVLAIVVPMFILPHIYKGGNYHVVDGMEGDCATSWYYNLLYLNNFSENPSCVSWSWYLANDFQMYLLTPFLVLIYHWKRVVAYLTAFGLILVSIGIQIYVFSIYKISVDMVGSNDDSDEENDYMKEYYRKPYCRINPFLIGVILAWMYIDYKKATKDCNDEEEKKEECNKFIMSKISHHIVTNSILRYTLYIIGFITMGVCVYTYFDFYKKDAEKSKLEDYIFIIFSRPGFIIGLAMFIYSGCLGKAGFLRSVLGYSAFNVLSKAVFSMYMFNMEIIAFYWGTREDTVYFGEYSMWIYSIDICMLTFLVAIFATLFFEYPIIGLSKEFLRPKRISSITGKSDETKS